MNNLPLSGPLAGDHPRRPLVTSLDALVFTVCLAGGAASNVVLDHPRATADGMTVCRELVDQDADRQHRLNQLTADFMAKAGAEGFTAADVLDQMSEMYQENSK